MNRKLDNQKAVEAYEKNLSEIEKLLAQLTQDCKIIRKHGKISKDPQMLDWGHVGDLGHLKEILKEAAQAKPSNAHLVR